AGAILDHYRRPFPTARSRRPTWMLAREVTGASDFLEQEAATALRALRDRPALLPWGDRDPVFSSADRDRLAAGLPRAVVHPLRGAGHFIQEDAPQEIAGAVQEWWAGAAGAAGAG
ncbi:MAG: alpha/beta hydrolase, partial [Actinomycetota bacterium]|nr:alpha/beta hydrolase [Actinomycetota bacterium]